MDSSQRADVIIRNASRLPIEERMELAKQMLERPDAIPEFEAEKKMNLLLPVAEKIVGQKMRYTRSAEDVKIRAFVSYYMWMGGQSVTEIGRAFGMHHSSIINYVNKVRDYFDLPVFYAKEVDEYLRFKEIADGIEG